MSDDIYPLVVMQTSGIAYLTVYEHMCPLRLEVGEVRRLYERLGAALGEPGAFRASVPWEDLQTTLFCARHWTPNGRDGELNFRGDHQTFERVAAWFDANGPTYAPPTEPKDELE